MTRNKWKKMNPLDKQLKVLELAGEDWEITPYDGISRWKRNGVSVMGHIVPPDVLNDLNVMHAIEDSVIFKAGKSLIDAYEENLLITVSDLTRKQWVDEIHHWHANAAQRAEAFVLTMDKE